jgi:hypothetical protein
MSLKRAVMMGIKMTATRVSLGVVSPAVVMAIFKRE